jgi:hypothetical protein
MRLLMLAGYIVTHVLVFAGLALMLLVCLPVAAVVALWQACDPRSEP